MNKIVIPKCLLPIFLSDPAQVGPRWLTPVPRIHKLKGNRAITLDPVAWLDKYGRYFYVPAGFLIDGVSLFWPLSLIWDRWDKRTLREATLHDFRYCMYDWLKQWPDTQKDADKDLLAGLKMGCPDRDHAYFIAVRFGGYSVYSKQVNEELVGQWLSFVDYPEQLSAWIDGVIAADKKAA
jgi:hypothetical protein